MIAKFKPLWRGLSATFLSLLVVSSLGYGVADTWRSSVDDVLGTESVVVDDSHGCRKGACHKAGTRRFCSYEER